MTEDRRRILTMLEQGKLTAAEAERLLDAVSGSESNETKAPPSGNPAKPSPQFLRVLVEDNDSEHGGKVNVRVPLNLIRAGVRLAALLPTGVHAQVNRALKENGVDFDVSQIKPENLEELVQHLNDLTVDVEGKRGEKVRVFCE